MADALVGRIATVTGRVAPGTVGEVAVNIRGGSESWFARPADGAEVIERGREVVVVSVGAGRTLFVTALDL